MLSLPAGARGKLLADGEVAELVRELPYWRAVAGISDALLIAGPSDGGREAHEPEQRPAGVSLDDGLLGTWHGAFGWVVAAEPVGPGDLEALSLEAGVRARDAEAAGERFPERVVEARRLKERHAELRRGVSGGFWRISLTVGAADEASAARVAGLLCASVDLAGLPYALSPAPVPRSGSSAGAAGEPGGDGVARTPFYGSTALLAALARPPEAEVPGVRLALRPEFDVTPETSAAGPDAGIALGEVLDRNLMPAGPFAISAESLNRHVFVCGATGAGKSQTVRCLLEAATERGIPWLVVEPAKAEYRLMAARLPGTEVIRIRPGEPDAVAAGLNPLEPAAAGAGDTAADGAGARFPLQTHADLVKALFIASFQAEEPFPQVLSAALGRVYEEAGWDLALGEPSGEAAAYPTLTSLQRTAERVVADIGYSQRVTDDVLGFIRVRLASLLQGTTGRFLEGGHPIDFGALLRRNVVLEIEDVGDDADKAFLMGTVLIRLAEYLRLTHRGPRSPAAGAAAGGLAHLTVVEEAHRLLRRAEPGAGGSGAGAHAVELFAGLLAEIRAYGEGLVIAEQIPARVAPDVIKNTAVKITHRLPADDDREAVGATMNATPAQSRYLVTLPPGQAAVSADGMDYPVLVRIKDGTEREVASPAPTADARAVVRPRSGSCGGECGARPCSLREMRGGQRLLRDVPWIPLWADLTVLAHLTGWPMPVPTPQALAAWTAKPVRLTQCALAHAADAAVAVRPGIARPGALAAHVAEAIRARAERQAWHCRPDEPEWLLEQAVTEETVFGVVRPAVLEAGALDRLPGTFIGWEWSAEYLKRSPSLPAGRVHPAVHRLVRARGAGRIRAQRRLPVGGLRRHFLVGDLAVPCDRGPEAVAHHRGGRTQAGQRRRGHRHPRQDRPLRRPGFLRPHLTGGGAQRPGYLRRDRARRVVGGALEARRRPAAGGGDLVLHVLAESGGGGLGRTAGAAGRARGHRRGVLRGQLRRSGSLLRGGGRVLRRGSRVLRRGGRIRGGGRTSLACLLGGLRRAARADISRFLREHDCPLVLALGSSGFPAMGRSIISSAAGSHYG
ncbi:MAG TPA: ATP-binding protein [Trebonia sp.]|nr:ATP-binding protein [Trebonia sp.]